MIKLNRKIASKVESSEQMLKNLNLMETDSFFHIKKMIGVKADIDQVEKINKTKCNKIEFEMMKDV